MPFVATIPADISPFRAIVCDEQTGRGFTTRAGFQIFHDSLLTVCVTGGWICTASHIRQSTPYTTGLRSHTAQARPVHALLEGVKDLSLKTAD